MSSKTVSSLFAILIYRCQIIIDNLRRLKPRIVPDSMVSNKNKMKFLRILDSDDDDSKSYDDGEIYLKAVYKKKKVVGLIADGGCFRALGVIGEAADSRLCLLDTGKIFKIIKVISGGELKEARPSGLRWYIRRCHPQYYLGGIAKINHRDVKPVDLCIDPVNLCLKYSLIDYVFNCRRFIKIRCIPIPGYVWNSMSFIMIKYRVQDRIFNGKGIGEEGFDSMKIEFVNFEFGACSNCYYRRCNKEILWSPVICGCCLLFKELYEKRLEW